MWSTSAGTVIRQQENNQGFTEVDDTVVSQPSAIASRPRIAHGNGTVRLGWADAREGGGTQIYSRTLSVTNFESNVTVSPVSVFNHALAVRDNLAFDLAWQDSRSGSNQIYYRRLERCATVALTVLDADNQGLAGCKGEYYAGGTLGWSKDTDPTGYTFDTNSTPATNAFCRAQTVSSHIDVRDEQYSNPPMTVQVDTTNLSTAGGGAYAMTINLTNTSGPNASEASVAFRETTRAWNFFNTGFRFARGLVTVNVDSANGPQCTGDNIDFPTNRARLRNGPPSATGRIDDTIVHEYSHAVQYSAYRNWGIPAGHTYRPTDNHEWINGLTDPDCSYDALWEGWAEFLPVALYNAYNPSDTHYGASDGTYEVNLEDGLGFPTSWRSTPDERNEFTVAMVYWDIFDAHNESGDNLSLGVFEIWDVLRDAKPKTFEEFFQFFISNAYYSQHAAGLEQICVMNGMHPNWLTLSRSALDFGQASTQQTFTIRLYRQVLVEFHWLG